MRALIYIDSSMAAQNDDAARTYLFPLFRVDYFKKCIVDLFVSMLIN